MPPCHQVLTLVGCLAAVACGEGNDNDGERSQGPTQVGDEVRGSRVVATVDGQPITADDVLRTKTEGESLADALDRLVELELMAAEALRRGIGTGGTVGRSVDRAIARVLLAREVEEVVNASTVPEERFREAIAPPSRGSPNPNGVMWSTFCLVLRCRAERRRVGSQNAFSLKRGPAVTPIGSFRRFETRWGGTR